MKREYESIDWDKRLGRVVITKQEYIELQDVTKIEDVKAKLKRELDTIIKQVKSLKMRAFEIKSLIDKLEGKAGPTDPAP